MISILWVDLLEEKNIYGFYLQRVIEHVTRPIFFSINDFHWLWQNIYDVAGTFYEKKIYDIFFCCM